MAIIQKPTNAPLDSNAHMTVPAKFIPSFRTCQAIERKVEHNLLIRAHGGLGDMVCAEPAIRYALNKFKGNKISLVTDYPQLFQHLKFEKVFSHSDAFNWNDYLLFQTYDLQNQLAWEFVSHTLTHAVDYASLNMWRMMLPIADKQITLVPTEQEYASIDKFITDEVNGAPIVLIHAGKTWASRTFPKHWWDTVIKTLVAANVTPVLIGGVVDNGRASTVDVETKGCLDLRSQLTLMESVALMHRSTVLLTNDSSPLHMATSGDTWIGFVSTVKHPDHLYHWRRGQWAWRMKDLSTGCLYNDLNFCPNNSKDIKVDDIHIRDMLQWLPDPVVFAKWAIEKLG